MSDYRKNICGYIVKKCIQEVANEDFRAQVDEICRQFGCERETVVRVYQDRAESVTGPSHLPPLFEPSARVQANVVMAFMRFCLWYLQNQYVRYLLTDGKMAQKAFYLRYKNNELIPHLLRI